MSPPSAGTPDTVLITGAARRIGRALALDLARNGWRIAIHCRNSRAEAEELAHEITGIGSSAIVLDCDLADADAVAKLIPRCADALAAPVCLINNASAFLPDSISEMSEDVWNTHLDVNLRTPVFLARALYVGLPVGRQGNVINIIDQRVWRLTPEFFSYTISKSGLWTATRTLAQAMAPRVRVNAIGPGPVLKSIHQTDDDFAAEGASTLLGRGPTPEEVAAAVRFILDAPAMTGQMIALDGGQHLTWASEPHSAIARPAKER